jgi:hypothetical protein
MEKITVQCQDPGTVVNLGQAHQTGVGQRGRHIGVSLEQGSDGAQLIRQLHGYSDYVSLDCQQGAGWIEAGSREQKAGFSDHSFTGQKWTRVA